MNQRPIELRQIPPGTDGITFHLTPDCPFLGDTRQPESYVEFPVMITTNRKRIALRQE